MNENENKTRRTLSSRLRSLVPSSSKSPPQSEPMRQPRPQPLKPKPRLAPLQPPMPSPPSSSQPSPVKSPLPILRWLGHHPSSTSLHSNASTPSSASSRSASPLSSLQDALSSPLPPPPQVTPPSASHQRTDSHSHLHPAYPSRPASMFAPNSPPFLHTFTRSTLPSTTLATPFQSSLYAHDPFDLAHHRNIYTPTLNYPVNIEHSPPQRTSLDTLRSLQDRERERVIHTQQPPSRKGSQHAQSNSYSTAASSAAPSSGWWWFQGDNKEDVDRLLDESDRAETVSQEQLKIHKKYLAPKNPLVFCHGLLGFDSVTIGPSIAPLEVTHWRGIKEVLEANGAEVLITRVPATSSPVERAKVLEKKIEEVYPGRKVHLIGHSMGGLDCRYLTTNLHSHTFTVLSVTTVATPHRGSTFADHFLETVGRSRLPQVLSLLDMLPNGGGDGQAFESLTIESMRKFNEETPDVEGVRYFSWGAVYDPGLIDTWKWPHSVVLEKEGPNDGLVSVESSKWGKYLGTLESVNHLDLVGWINTARYKWAELRGKEIKFRPATFYLGVADFLAQEVEHLGDGPTKERASVEDMGRRVAAEAATEGAAEDKPGSSVHGHSSVGSRGTQLAKRTSNADDPWDAASDTEDEDDVPLGRS